MASDCGTPFCLWHKCSAGGNPAFFIETTRQDSRLRGNDRRKVGDLLQERNEEYVALFRTQPDSLLRSE
jgi:hypothetical protein